MYRLAIFFLFSHKFFYFFQAKMTGYLTLILFYFFDSLEKHFTCAENVKIFTILQNKLYKIAFFSKTIRNGSLRIVSIEIFCHYEQGELSIHQIRLF